jgi:NADP-dependent 3-hydroxy acid dehydrogenase YdfG
MLDPKAVAESVLFAVSQPQDVNIDELRLSRS